jgi:hypothetical protein
MVQNMYLDVLHELVGCVGVAIGEGGVHGERDAGARDCQQDEDFEPFCLRNLHTEIKRKNVVLQNK